jgi:flagellar basal-body rod modification protein FlgD
MASVNATSNTAQEVIAGLSSPQNKGKQNATEEMNDRFLTLFVTQLKNQDPLNPLDNAQVTSQLAQISTVQGIESLNGTLNRLLEFYEGGQAMQAASMIGKSVLIPGNALSLGNGMAVGGIELANAADRVKVDISDANGLLMRTLDLGAQQAGHFGFSWDGKTDAGVSAVDGRYTFKVNAVQGENTVAAEPLGFGTVSAVVRANGGFQLDLGEAGTVGFDAVRSIL